jgi:DNA-binding IclR family transcriptional regulator
MKLQAPPNRNTSLEKASRILFAFDEETAQLGVMDIARRVGLNKSTVSRFVSSLTELGLLERVEGGRKVRLSLRLYEIGMMAVRHRPILSIVGSTLTRTAARIGETCAVGVLIGEEVVFLERAGGGHESVRLELGRRFPACRSSAGQVLLAGSPLTPTFDFPESGAEGERVLSAIRSSGYATEVGQMIEGVNSVAAPILDRSGAPVAALAVLTNRRRRGDLIPTKLVHTVTSAAAEVSGKLGYYRAKKGEKRVGPQARPLRAKAS